MTDAITLFLVSGAVICAGHLFLAFSEWHADGVLGVILYGALGVVAAVPPLAFVFGASEYLESFRIADANVRAFLVLSSFLYAAVVLRKVYVTECDRRRARTKQNRRGEIGRREPIRADAVRN